MPDAAAEMLTSMPRTKPSGVHKFGDAGRAGEGGSRGGRGGGLGGQSIPKHQLGLIAQNPQRG